MVSEEIKQFDRRFFDGEADFTRIGMGSIGGKAQGLANISNMLNSRQWETALTVNIPRLTVITSHYFDRFMAQNELYEIAMSDASDERIAHHFQRAALPADLIGDLRVLIAGVHTPLAIRSSSLLEDSLAAPFAGIYETKMIANNQRDTDSRFRHLVEAIKYVYSSTFFKKAKDYAHATGNSIAAEKMAVIIQEIVGNQHGESFYPDISGVARSYNFYPCGHATPEDGVVHLALGLGKTIVDGGFCWSYSPAYPSAAPPYGSVRDFLQQTQKKFWTVNMGKIPVYDPVNEIEYLWHHDLQKAESDGVLSCLASTYDPQMDRINIGTGSRGPRIITFAPILAMNFIPLNELIKELLDLCERTTKAKVEIEFAATIDSSSKKARLGLLQVRPMHVSEETIDIDEHELNSANVLAASKKVLGNGSRSDISDIVYLKPDNFTLANSRKIAMQIQSINRQLLEQGRPYLLIGFGRWGSSDPWLGVPVNWGQISGARAIVEATLPGVMVDLSQGAHFFHNIANLGITYFSIEPTSPYPIGWQWLSRQTVQQETEMVRHLRLSTPLSIKVDGRKRMGVITHGK